MQAASEGNIPMLRILLENGVSADLEDYDKRTALHHAAAEGQLAAAYFLVYRRAHPQGHAGSFICLSRIGILCLLLCHLAASHPHSRHMVLRPKTSHASFSFFPGPSYIMRLTQPVLV